jgi:3-oxoacyl-[acyl-carrier-protein] synthase-3
MSNGRTRARISSLATYVPPRVLTNADLEKMVDTNDEWILQRTGIRERHLVDPGVATSDLAAEAAREAIARAGLTPRTSTSSSSAPPLRTCSFPARRVCCRRRSARSMRGDTTCSPPARVHLRADHGGADDRRWRSRRALVVGADVMSSIIDYTDRTTCVIFGDGAGAAVVEASDDPTSASSISRTTSTARGGQALCMPAGGSLRPASHETVEQRLHYVKQDGQAVFRFAVRNTEEACRRILNRNQIKPSEIDLLVSHQANRRIIQLAAEKLGLPLEKVIINIEKFGNTTAATIPLALNDAVQDCRLKRATSSCWSRSARGSRWARFCSGGASNNSEI